MFGPIIKTRNCFSIIIFYYLCDLNWKISNCFSKIRSCLRRANETEKFLDLKTVDKIITLIYNSSISNSINCSSLRCTITIKILNVCYWGRMQEVIGALGYCGSQLQYCVKFAEIIEWCICLEMILKIVE